MSYARVGGASRACPSLRRRAIPTQRRCSCDGRTRSYFLRRAPARLAARKEIPARMAFCCTAAAVRPSFLATIPVGVPDFASALSAASSRALQDAPSFGGRRAIIVTPYISQRRAGPGDHTPINARARVPVRSVTCWKCSARHVAVGGDVLLRRTAHRLHQLATSSLPRSAAGSSAWRKQRGGWLNLRRLTSPTARQTPQSASERG